jgi:2-methylcitrate dehydratase
VFGSGVRTTPDLAAFANAIMVRTYDWNDGMQAKGGGHPSDMIPGILAIAELEHATGIDTLVAVALAYELLGGLGSATDRKAFDQGLFMGAAVALAGGKLMRLDEQQLANAASLAVTTALPLQVSRWGSLSMMKGAATAFAVRNGVFAAQLARRGFTAAPEPFEGYLGLWEVMGEFTLQLPVLPEGPSAIEMAHQKPVPAETQVLGILDHVPEIRAWSTVEEIESIDVELAERTARHVADPPKYDPQTRETADHSLPYMLAAALTDGTLTLAPYAPERFRDPALRPLMQRIHVTANERLTRIREDERHGVTRSTPAIVRVRRRDGEVYEREIMFHKGHLRNPMTRADIDDKWDRICEGTLDAELAAEIRDAWWNTAAVDDIGVLVHMLGAAIGEPVAAA